MSSQLGLRVWTTEIGFPTENNKSVTNNNNNNNVRRVLGARTDSVDGLPVGHQAKAVLENSSGVKQRHRDSHDALQPVL